MELITALRFLRLNEISEAWTDAVWALEFTERKEIDDPVGEELSALRPKDFKRLYDSLLVFSQEDAKTEQSVWAMLQENGISVKTLVAVLSLFVFGGKSKNASVKQRVNALHAASLYLLLLGLPGSIANKAFHGDLLDMCTDIWIHCWPQDMGKKRKKEPPKGSQADGKRAKPRRKDTQTNFDEEEEEDEEEKDAAEHFSGQDLVEIRAAVVLLVGSLFRLLQIFSLKDLEQSARNCTQVFIKLLYFEPIIGEINFAEQNISNMRSVPEMAFHGLQLLYSPKHGHQEKSLIRIFHQLLYVILMMNKTSSIKPTLLAVSQGVLAARNQAIHFVCHMVNEMKELALSCVRILLQHICVQMVEKSEFRSHGAQAVGRLAALMSSPGYAWFVRWLANFSQNSKMAGRLFSVDVVMALLEQPERNPEGCEAALVQYLPHKYLIQEVLFARRMDVFPTVQGHALACLAQCLELPSMNATRAVQGLFTTIGSQSELHTQATEGSVTSHQTQTYRTLPFRTVELSNTDSSACEGKVNLEHLLRRVKHTNTNVRKSALQAVMGLLKHNVVSSTWENLSVLAVRCRDPAVSVKKKALQCVGELLSVKPGCSDVQKAWLEGVCSAVMDSESSVQEKALEALDEVILGQIKVFSEKTFMDMSQRLAWDLLHRLCHDCHNLSRYFSKAFDIWHKQNRFTPSFFSALVSHTMAPHAAGAWLVLSKMVISFTNVHYGKILDAWDKMTKWNEVNTKTLCNVLCVIGDIAPHLNPDTQERIIEDLMSQLKTFTLSLNAISAAVEALVQYGRSEDIMLTQTFLNQHCGELVTLCESYLASIILKKDGTQNLDEDLMVKYLHTLGMASLNCPAKISKRTILLVESILTTNSDQLADVQGDLPASLPLSQFRANSFSSKIRAHGVLTLGKLCLQHVELVQKYLPVFARELEEGTEVSVRNNVVVIMCDLCIRYTNTVDYYIPNISARLRDKSATIRENTLIMLTNLLQEEYVKWKGSLFFRFITALVDPIPSIANMCEYCLLNVLLEKSPEMFSQHFIECIFYFNSYTQHKSYNKFPQSDKDVLSSTLKGPQNREKRFHIYRFLLEHCTDVQRFSITNKINQTVLVCFADGELPLDSDGADILSETFGVLSLKEMKLRAMKSSSAAVGEEPEAENMAKAVLETAQKKVVSQVHKKVFIEHTVPLIISLKHCLEQKRSSVLKDLMLYLQVTMQDYKNEVKEFFAGDEQLASELEYALKEAEKQKVIEEMENCSIMPAPKNTSTAQNADLGSPAKPRPVLALRFSTPQPPRQNSLSSQLPLTERRPNNVLRREDQGRSNYLEETVIPKGKLDTRAISTPNAAVNVNLTFDEGLSAILSDRGLSSMEDTGVLRVCSSEQRVSGARQWNVQSPLRKRNQPRMRISLQD
ncbi:condensin-2 complex subunit D3 isoform X2 [Boleophthalmus pectinirostris]|uniref:condensin-2 complex subunit D3 isoform X2 n=1 Tax=Boleophthalmus pectinirostris TaxID=150288 RepID=UPI00242E08E9|nr:condensin-2 complex subunit D3 isoform X2 [Boleophthalmus pectinirostris]